MKVQAHYYQQFDADLSLDVPAEGYGGWKKGWIEIAPGHTALVVMHAWDFGTPEQFPGWCRCVEYIPRAQEICRKLFSPLLEAVRASDMKVFHFVGGGTYYKDYPGYKRAVELAGSSVHPPDRIRPDSVLEMLRWFQRENVLVGKHNEKDVERGFEKPDFASEARPVDNEGIAENEHQLFSLCKDADVSHLVYIGFAINWCLLVFPAGMVDMSRRGFMCSTIRQAVTAAENRETARREFCKELALWRVALAYGFVFDAAYFIDALRKHSSGGQMRGGLQ